MPSATVHNRPNFFAQHPVLIGTLTLIAVAVVLLSVLDLIGTIDTEALLDAGALTLAVLLSLTVISAALVWPAICIGAACACFSCIWEPSSDNGITAAGRIVNVALGALWLLLFFSSLAAYAMRFGGSS